MASLMRPQGLCSSSQAVRTAQSSAPVGVLARWGCNTYGSRATAMQLAAPVTGHAPRGALLTAQARRSRTVVPEAEMAESLTDPPLEQRVSVELWHWRKQELMMQQVLHPAGFVCVQGSSGIETFPHTVLCCCRALVMPRPGLQPPMRVAQYTPRRIYAVLNRGGDL